MLEMLACIPYIGLASMFMYFVNAFFLSGGLLDPRQYWLGIALIVPLPHVPHIMAYFSTIILAAYILLKLDVRGCNILMSAILRFLIILPFFILFFGAGISCFPSDKHTFLAGGYCGVITMAEYFHH